MKDEEDRDQRSEVSTTCGSGWEEEETEVRRQKMRIAKSSNMLSLMLATSGTARSRRTPALQLPGFFLRFESYSHARAQHAGNLSQVCQRVAFVTG